jgi:hypothetical protein
MVTHNTFIREALVADIENSTAFERRIDALAKDPRFSGHEKLTGPDI